MPKSVAIAGAGMAGLGAARMLVAAGCRVTIYEKSQGVGGRVATRRIEGCILDHGAQIIKPDGSELADVMLEELPAEDLIQISAPTRPYAPDGTLREPDPARNAERKFTYRYGLTTLPKLLQQPLLEGGVRIRYETRIAALEKTREGMVLRDENGETLGIADYIIVTAPTPQAADLLAASRLGEDTAKRVEMLRAVPYSQCLTLLLGYAAPAPPAPAYALLAQDRECPLLWLAFEQTKAAERAPNGEGLLIAQFGPQWSAGNYDAPGEILLAETLRELKTLFGAEYAAPHWHQVKRWRYSQPRGFADFAAVNSADSPVIICGDGLRPDNGRVHQAFASGIEAAQHILNT